MLDHRSARWNIDGARSGRAYGRGTATTRRPEGQACFDGVEEIADGVGTTGKLDSHQDTVLFVHDREVFSVLAVDVFGHIDGTRVAALAEVVTGLVEGGGTLGAVADVTVKLFDYELLGVVHVADDEGRLDDFSLARHGLGTGRTGLNPRRAAWSFYGDEVTVDIVLG